MRTCTLCGRTFPRTADGAYRLASHTMIRHAGDIEREHKPSDPTECCGVRHDEPCKDWCVNR